MNISNNIVFMKMEIKFLKKLSTDQPYFDNVSRNTTLFILGVM